MRDQTLICAGVVHLKRQYFPKDDLQPVILILHTLVTRSIHYLEAP